MAKNFPYFKFIASEWLTGDIIFETLEAQGLFINICALYWQRDGNLTVSEVNKRHKEPTAMQSLTDRFFLVSEDKISIKFLDEQLIEAGHISKINSANGKKGAEARLLKTKGNKATAKRPPSDSQPPLSKKEKEENKKKIEEIVSYLNLKTDKNLSSETKETVKHLTARLAKYSVEDAKKVIDIKVAEWTGTEWEKYLVPDTLFSESNFEKYLNQKPRESKRDCPYTSDQIREAKRNMAAFNSPGSWFDMKYKHVLEQ